MTRLRHILDENRLTPAAVLLTHGHIDHIWSAQKVSDTYGCPTYIHPEDRFMLTEPLRSLGTLPGQALFGVLSRVMFSEPKQLVELDRDGDKIGLGDTTVAVDHTPGTPAVPSSSGSQASKPRWSSAGTPCFRTRSVAPTCPVAADAI